MTTRLCQAIQAIGLGTCGRLGARLASRLGITTSWMTIVRRVMALPTQPAEQVQCLGIDDFSFLRGRTFGTVLVDLNTHRVIDLLPDRQAETATIWMRTHAEITHVSRDRGSEYASAASRGAPQAIQVADRFHVAKNLSEAVQELLARVLTELKAASEGEAAPASAGTGPIIGRGMASYARGAGHTDDLYTARRARGALSTGREPPQARRDHQGDCPSDGDQ